MDVLHHPRRLELSQDTKLGYDATYNAMFDVCILQDIEKYNFGITPAGTLLGFTHEQGLTHFHLDNGDPVEEILELHGQWLITKKPLKLFMVTTRVDIALSDCLFYFVEIP